MRLLILLIALPAFAQPTVENARVQARAYAGSVESTLRRLGSGPLWAAWVEPSRGNRDGSMCGWNNSLRQASMHLEGNREIVILVRIDSAKVDKIQVTTTDCKLDAGGLSYFWIEKVPAQQSVAWLQPQITADHPDPALVAIAMHEASVSDPVLDALLALSQPEKIRTKAVFWLGNLAGRHGVETLRKVLATDESEHVRREVTFGLSQSKEPEALALLIDTAKNDQSTAVRGQAIFWLSQKAGNKQASAAIGSAVDDPNRQIKEKAVFALSQIPNNEGVPKLIDLAKTSKDPDVRKKAAFWLGQSKDPRAMQFFEQVLR